MNGASESVEDWRWMRDRVSRIERINRRLRKLGTLAIRVNVIVVVAIVGWLVWPGKTLTTDRLTATRSGASAFWTGQSGLYTDSVRVADEGLRHMISFGHTRAGGPYLQMEGDTDLRAQFYGSPSIRIAARPFSMDPADRQPRIELSFDAGWAPRILLRDGTGATVWQAP
jgi:hypothetical protein